MEKNYEFNNVRVQNLNWGSLANYFSGIYTPRETARVIRKLCGLLAESVLMHGEGSSEMGGIIGDAMFFADAVDDLDLGVDISEWQLIPKVGGQKPFKQPNNEKPFELI